MRTKVRELADAVALALGTAESSDEILTKKIDELTAQVDELAAQLYESERRMRSIVDTAADAIITIDEKGTIQEFNGAAEETFRYSAEEIKGKNVALLMPDPYRTAHDGYLHRYLETGEPRIIGKTRELKARRKDGSIFPIELSVSAVNPLGLFTAIIRDLTEHKALQRENLKIAEWERCRIGQELHDGIQQELTGVGLMAQNLADALRDSSSDDAELAAKLAARISVANDHVHSLARGLIPVAVAAEGLMPALSELAEATASVGGLSCTLVCPEPISVADDVAATQIYRMAQEAVTNALKHAEASRITIVLSQTDGAIRLEVQDDGVGIDEEFEPEKSNGLGIMRHRCELMGGNLEIGRPTTGGTAVACVVPLH